MKNNDSVLGWKQIYQITHYAANVLNYLHNFIIPPYIYKNLKCRNKNGLITYKMDMFALCVLILELLFGKETTTATIEPPKKEKDRDVVHVSDDEGFINSFGVGDGKEGWEKRERVVSVQHDPIPHDAMDIDFGDLDGPSKAPAAKPAKFAPKNSRLKPVAKPKQEPEAPVPASAAVPKVEIEDIKPSPPTPPPVTTVYSKTEIEQPSHTVPPSHDPNGDVKLDTDATEMEVDNDLSQDEEDKVVREIDVFFNSSTDANSKLYVLQYPLRQRWRPYELEDRCEKVRLKPETAEVEVEMSVQVDSENYDREVDDDKAMKKQVLSTSWKPPIANGYAVGILVGNEIHLNPVDAVVQLRPSMQHLKSSNLLKKMNGTRADVDMIDSEDIKDEKIKKQPKKQSKLPGAVNEQNEDSKEEWISLKYHSESSPLSHKCIENMVVAPEASPIQFSMSQSDYIDSLCPATTVKPKGPPVSTWLKLPLDERYKGKLREGPPVRFNVLKHIAPDSNIEDMFKVLQTHAQLVQGLWVAKSTLKYGKDVGKELLLRNYVMLQFSKSPIFHETQLPKTTSLSELMKTILDEFAARRESCRDWKFRETTDHLFIKEYPYIVEEQKKIWDRVEPQIIEILFPKNSKHGVHDRRPILNNMNKVETKTATVPTSKGVMLDETREALPKALVKLFQAYKVCSLNQIRQRLRDMAVSENTLRKGTREARAAAAAADAPQEELLKTLNQVAVNLHGVFVSKSSPDHPQYDDFRNIVINLLRAEGPKGRLKRASIEAAAEMQLKRKPSDTEFKKVLTEICITQNSAWVLKSGDGSPT
ncbi:hypothetical protein L2E82_18486 [Cichorium intybus]|uniref:Uncharacterized protein n=1 Tax=Cichorium intybus TaxID=13427 RepID=A0ACB9FAT3_CICIN|nr:hypothetical protein L2E82_18486 [Cichorium intybus]